MIVAAQPVNPVSVLYQAGATPAAGSVYGSRDVYGDLYASGSIPGPGCTGACGEQVTVYSLQPGQTAQGLMAQSGMAPSDSEAVITTPVAVILVTPVDEVMNGGGLTY